MANYKVHLSTGVLLGIIGAVLSLVFLANGQYVQGLLIMLFISIGSILPDLDSDDSVPFKIVFWMFSVISGVGAFYFLRENYQFNIFKNAGIALGALFFVRFVAGWIFMQFTRHRGMFHSIPASVIFGLICFYFLDSLKLEIEKNLILSFALFIGYISHLVLDEIYAGVNFEGIFFNPKQSLGTALKLFSKSQLANITTYSLLIILGAALWPKVNLEAFRFLFRQF